MATCNVYNMDKKSHLTSGCVVICKTNLGKEFEGEVICYDEETKALVIKLNPKKKLLCDVVVLNLNMVTDQNFNLVSFPKNDSHLLLDIDREKVEKRLRSAKERVGIGVTAEAQLFFDFLTKTFPCRWSGTNIIALEDICISPPYQLENFSSETSSMDYVKTVVVHKNRQQVSKKVIKKYLKNI
ncbi:protein LSM12 homolog A isoform X2 [Hydra vulgaris]|uniref:Protein LSM12 homolog A isoform X2 n=1 Tax=Hydra vulgaris TaxID=6087 RepID=A0ABM4CXV2_HYDVU